MYKILNITPVDSANKLPPWLLTQIRSIEQHGIVCEIFKFRGSALTVIKPIKSILQVLSLGFTVSTTKCDIIHAHWGSGLGFLTVLSNLRNKPVVLTLRGSDVNRTVTEKYFHYIFKKILTNFSVLCADLVIYVSQDLYKKAIKKSGNYLIIPDGTPTEIFFPRKHEDIRKGLNWDPKSKYVLFFTLNRPVEKNLRLAIEVMEMVQKKVANCHFLIIEEIMSQEELSLLFSAADLLLFTSTSEGSPNLVRESIACGCPVVSVRVGDVEKWINLSGSGKVCDYDPKNIVDAVVDSLTLPKSVLPHTADYFSTSESSKNLLKAYSKIVNGIKPLKS